MSWLSRLIRKVYVEPHEAAVEAFRQAATIDTSEPEFFDLHPTRLDIARRFREAGLFHAERSDGIADETHAALSGKPGASLQGIIRLGPLLKPDELRAIGYRSDAKLGRDFVDALAVDDVRAGVERFKAIARVAQSRAAHLHNLRRMQSAGIERVTFLSGLGAEGTAIERKYDGVEMSISDARRIAIDHEEDITRGTFAAVVRF